MEESEIINIDSLFAPYAHEDPDTLGISRAQEEEEPQHVQPSSSFFQTIVDSVNTFNDFVADCCNKITGALPVDNNKKDSVRNKLIKYDTTIITPTLAAGFPTNRQHLYQVMFDSGATRDFISRSIVEHLNLRVERADDSFSVALADGSIKQVSEVVRQVPLRIGDFSCNRDLYLLDLAGLDIVMGKPFLHDFNCQVDFTTNVTNIRSNNAVHVLHPSGMHNSCNLHHCDLVNHAEIERARSNEEKVFAAYMVYDQPDHAVAAEALHTISMVHNNKAVTAIITAVDEVGAAEKMGKSEFDERFKPQQDDTKDMTVDDFNFLSQYFKGKPTLIADGTDNVDAPRKIDGKPVYHRIITEEGKPAPCKQTYRLSPSEIKTLKTQLDEMLQKGFVRPSNSEYGAPVLFAPKPDGTLRLCLDYRDLNSITLKDRYPLPRDSDLFDQLADAKVVSSIDLLYGYWQVLIHPEDIHKTAIRTPLGAYEFIVMPMGLCNAPSTFQRMMESVLRPYLTKFCMVYLDDLIIYSKNHNDHRQHLKLVLDALDSHQLKIKLKKCDFFMKRIKFLGHIIDVSRDYVTAEANPEKVEVISQWQEPQNNTELQSFLGAVNYFSRMIPNYAARAAPLTSIMADKWNSNNRAQYWKEEHSAAFKDMRQALTEKPVLALPRDNLPYLLQTDASDIATGGVLYQVQENGDRVVIAYLSHKFNKTERNWPVHERELWGLVHALR